MSEKQFKKRVNLSCIDTETGKTYWYACNLRGLLNELTEENERLRKQIQNYEQLISNSYVGEEETLDGFVGKYVIWENELQKYRKKNKK